MVVVVAAAAAPLEASACRLSMAVAASCAPWSTTSPPPTGPQLRQSKARRQESGQAARAAEKPGPADAAAKLDKADRERLKERVRREQVWVVLALVGLRKPRLDMRKTGAPRESGDESRGQSGTVGGAGDVVDVGNVGDGADLAGAQSPSPPPPPPPESEPGLGADTRTEGQGQTAVVPT